MIITDSIDFFAGGYDFLVNLQWLSPRGAQALDDYDEVVALAVSFDFLDICFDNEHSTWGV